MRLTVALVGLLALTASDPALAQIKINEVDYDQPGTDSAEFVELFNVSNVIEFNLDLYALELVNGTGGGATVYETVDLPDVALAPLGYYVICVDALSVPNCDLEGFNQVENGAPDAVALRLSGALEDTVSYEGNTAAPYTESSGVGLEDPGTAGSDGLGISRFPDGTDTQQNNIDFVTRCSTPGAENSADSSGCNVVPGTLEVFDIQGSGTASPFVGSIVSTDDNVVTVVGPDGFFIQTPDARDDADTDTSNGIWVYTETAPTVQVGDLVDVSGMVEEFFDFTELTSTPTVTIESTGNPLPTAITLDATTPGPGPATAEDLLERYEGMRVTMPVGLTSSGTDQFDETRIVATTERSFREPGIAYPGLPGLPVWDSNPEVIKIDPPATGLPPFSAFAGHAISAEGALGYDFGTYSLRPSSLTVDDVVDPPTPVGPAASHEFTVATQNLLFLFDDQDDPNTGEPVPTPQEFQDRLTKASLWVRTVLGAPDILALQEVENLNVLTSLAAQIVADDPTLVYSAHLIEGNDVSGIDVGYLTRDGRVTVNVVDQFGEDLLLSVDGSLLYDRPPLVLEATLTSPDTDPLDLTVINVHQRSLGGIEGTDATRVKIKRFEQAAELALFIQGLQQATPDIHLLATGDFNAFEFTDGYVDVMGQITGNLDPLGDEIGTTDTVDPDLKNWTFEVDPGDRYTFVFQGSASALDHAVTSSALSPRVRRAEYGRGNSDAPVSFATDPSTALRTSDHDGLVLFIAAPSEIFSDGFESGDTSAWDAVVGGS